MNFPPEFSRGPLLWREQARLHASIVRWSVASSAVAGLVVVALLIGTHSPWKLLAWFLALTLVLVMRLRMGGAALPESDTGIVRLLRYHRLAFAVHGVIWGTAGCLLLAGLPAEQFEAMCFVLVAIATGALISTPFDLRAALAFALPTLAPLVWFWLGLGAGSTSMGYALALLLITLLVSATRARALVNDTLNLRLKQQAQAEQARQMSMQSVQARLDLAHKTHLLTALMDSSEQGFWLSDADGVCTELNPAMCQLLGRDPNEVLGHSIFSFFEGDDLQVLRDIRATRTLPGRPRGRELGINRPDGTRVHCHVNATPIRDEQGGIQGIVGVWTDLTQRRESDLSLRIHEVALNSISELVSVVDENIRYHMVNDAWCRYIGRPREAVLGLTTREAFAASPSAERRRLLRECLEEQKVGRVVDSLGSDPATDQLIETTFYPFADDSLGARSAVMITRDVTAERRSLRRIQESEAEYRTLLDSFPGYIGAFNQRYEYIYVNHAAAKALGSTREALIGQPLRDVLGESSYERCRRNTALAMERGKPVVNEVVYPATESRKAMTVEVTQVVGPIRADGTQTIYVFGIDVTERKRQEADLRVAAVSFESQDAMFITDARGSILRVNQAFISASGFSATDVIGRSPRMLVASRHERDFVRELKRKLLATGSWTGELWSRRKEGDAYPTWLTITAVRDGAGQVTNLVGLQMDLSKHKSAEQRIENLAFFDAMTQLANRTLLMQRLNEVLATTASEATRGALLLIDLDQFKTLNDSLGHDTGDLLLQLVAMRIDEVVEPAVCVARIGGDEFAVVLAGLPDDSLASEGQMRETGERVLGALRRSFRLGLIEHSCTASAGVTLFRGEEFSAEELLRQAEMAMYQSKEQGRDRLTFFDPQMQAAMTERASMEARIRQALAEERFSLHYQAQVGADQRVVGAEALIRWHHPELGSVRPDQFIGVAEDSGLIIPMGHWVLETACRQLARWAESPRFQSLTLAVNVSAHQLHSENFVEQVIQVLELTGANPKRLKLELTESLLVNNVEAAIQKMTALRSLGISFSLDDFGTGYSSLAYLSRLPLDQLKIDRSFVQDIELREEAVAICSATISLAHSLGMRVVAEGVETETQRYVLSTVHKCDFIQGYLFSRPLPLKDFESFAELH